MSKWRSGLGKSVTIRIRSFLFQTPPATWQGLGTWPRYKAPSDLRVEIVKMQWLALGEWDCPLDNAPKLAVGSQIAVKESQDLIYMFYLWVRSSSFPTWFSYFSSFSCNFMSCSGFSALDRVNPNQKDNSSKQAIWFIHIWTRHSYYIQVKLMGNFFFAQ